MDGTGATMPPPAPAMGPLGWLRRHLFATPVDTALSLLVLAALALVVPPLVGWAFVEADWRGTSRADCAGTGACWVFIRVRLGQFLTGFYPAAERWRVALAFALAVIIAAPLLIPRMRGKGWIGAFLLMVFPVIAYFLLAGGGFGLAVVETRLWGGLMLTLVIAVTGIVGSFPIGVVLALGRRSDMPVIRAICIAFIELWRGVPLITVLFMASVMLPLFLPEGVSLDKLLRALIGVMLFAAAYMAEVVRGGLQAIPRGQYEAAAALGLGYWRTMALVILPQALRHVIPGIVNTFIGLFKDTTLVLIIGLFDFLGIIQAASTDPKWLGFAVEGYVFAAAVFWCFCFTMSRISLRLETRLASEGADRSGSTGVETAPAA